MNCPPNYHLLAYNSHTKNKLCEKSSKSNNYPNMIIVDSEGNTWAHEYDRSNKGIDLCLSKKIGPLLTCETHGNIVKYVDIQIINNDSKGGKKIRKSKKGNKKMKSKRKR
jgi:hypothetical protein